jgi:hypothetical protein
MKWPAIFSISVMFFCIASITNASVITIDFESLDSSDVTGPDQYGIATFSTDEFNFIVKGGLGNAGGNKYAYGSTSGNFHEPVASINFSRTDNTPFSLLDLDILQCNGTCTIWGSVNGGGSISTNDVSILGTGDWLNIRNAEIFGTQTTYSLSVDNIEVNTIISGSSAIPLPAAIWLFSSGLAVCIWVRRKRRPSQ